VSLCPQDLFCPSAGTGRYRRMPVCRPGLACRPSSNRGCLIYIIHLLQQFVKKIKTNYPYFYSNPPLAGTCTRNQLMICMQNLTRRRTLSREFCISGKLSYGHLYFRANVFLNKCYLSNCISGQILLWANVFLGNRLSGQMCDENLCLIASDG
jgi:hypothetical protein